ncbi:hypothetical protein DWU98_14855 [Dyella monticola]|uniref:Uncharacterized protein n=1 Tax=Dyella monticola TaxID=1927958 RepID=A0A370WVZ2_9GAMM|nr:hypothetical protein [Dyella monticola]RDS80187.1 hypothetical protein DWU98_14855 [Dyella monticola]
MKAFLRYVALIALTVCLTGFLLYLMARFIDAAWTISDHDRYLPLLYFFTLLTSFELAALTVAGGRLYHGKRSIRPARSVVRYVLALNLNIITMLIVGRLLTGAMFLSLKNMERWQHAYSTFVMHLVALDPLNCNCEVAEDVFVGFTFALSCALALPFVAMITRRFRISAL